MDSEAPGRVGSPLSFWLKDNIAGQEDHLVRLPPDETRRLYSAKPFATAWLALLGHFDLLSSYPNPSSCVDLLSSSSPVPW